jgi:hypothetical protein
VNRASQVTSRPSHIQERLERHFGYGVARAYADHTDNTGPAITTYIKASLHEVATALATMTGQPHPMADP